MEQNEGGASELVNEVVNQSIVDAQDSERRSRFLSTDERRRATEMLMAGESIRKISRELNRAHSSIHKVKLDLIKGSSWNSKRTKKRKSKLDDEKYVKLIEEKLWEAKHSGGHLTVCEMAKLLKCSASTAHAWFKKQNFAAKRRSKVDLSGVATKNPTTSLE